MPALDQWLSEYGESHQNESNKLIHWICVPAIFFSITGLLYAIKLPFLLWDFQMNVAVVVIALAMIYYMSLSKTLWIGLFIFTAICLIICEAIERTGASLWVVCLIVFILAWVGQFYGHKIEGKKPSFLKDLQFLLIGPAWLMSFIYKKLKISF